MSDYNPVVPLSAINVVVTLPNGITFKQVAVDIKEDFRVRNAEGLADQGYTVPVITGRKSSGKVSGFLEDSDLGFGNQTELFQGVTGFTVTYDNGYGSNYKVTFPQITLENFMVSARVGDLTKCSFDFTSFGEYYTTFSGSSGSVDV
jgi:hypothetical protein